MREGGSVTRAGGPRNRVWISARVRNHACTHASSVGENEEDTKVREHKRKDSFLTSRTSQGGNLQQRYGKGIRLKAVLILEDRRKPAPGHCMR